MSTKHSQNFIDLANEAIAKTLSTSDVEMMNRASDRVENKKSRDPQDIALHKKNKELRQHRKNLVNKLKNFKLTEDEENPDVVDQTPSDDAPAPTVAAPVSTEGEVFYVDLIKKALFLDLDNVDLSRYDREMIMNDITPENAKDAVEVFNKIIEEYGL